MNLCSFHLLKAISTKSEAKTSRISQNGTQNLLNHAHPPHCFDIPNLVPLPRASLRPRRHIPLPLRPSKNAHRYRPSAGNHRCISIRRSHPHNSVDANAPHQYRFPLRLVFHQRRPRPSIIEREKRLVWDHCRYVA